MSSKTKRESSSYRVPNIEVVIVPTVLKLKSDKLTGREFKHFYNSGTHDHQQCSKPENTVPDL